MSLLGGDLTTPQRASVWLPNAPAIPSPIITQLIGSMTNLIYAKLNRARTFNQTFTRVFDGVGTMQLILPDYPVTGVISVQQGSQVVQQSALPSTAGVQPAGTCQGYGWRIILWAGNLPGENAVLEFKHGFFYTSVQNIRVVYNAGYLISAEAQIVPATAPYSFTVMQPMGIWCRDNGVVYASTGAALTPVTSLTGTAGQYLVGPDATPGLYTVNAADAGASLLVSYSFIPADLEEACIQMVAERYSYRSRVGEESKSLGGQETVKFMRGGTGRPWSGMTSLPPEVMDLINPYISVVPPNIGAPI